MKYAQLKIVREAVKILKKEPIAKHCAEYDFGCFQCNISELIEKFALFVEEHLQSDEEIDTYLKKYDKMMKKIEKNNPK